MSALWLFPQRTNACHSLTSRPLAVVDYHKDRLGKGSAGSSGISCTCSGADNNSELPQLQLLVPPAIHTTTPRPSPQKHLPPLLSSAMQSCRY